MCTKSQRSSSFIRSALIVALILMTSQAIYSQSSLSGLGVEIGGGYNQYFSQFFLPPLKGFQNNYTHFVLTPEARVKYDLHLSNMLTCIPFIGYNQFGGQHNYNLGSDPNYPEQDKIWINALEIGFITTYTVKNISFGIGYKVNRHIKVTYWFDYQNNQTYNDDVTNQYRPWSHDIGLRMSYRLFHYSITAESWFGISELGGDGDLAQMNIHQNHFRLLLGYTL